MLCAGGPVTSLVELTLITEHRRGHGAMYDALNQGRVDPQRLRRAVASLPLPRVAEGGSCSRWMSARGCTRTPRPAGTGWHLRRASTAVGTRPRALTAVVTQVVTQPPPKIE